MRPWQYDTEKETTVDLHLEIAKIIEHNEGRIVQSLVNAYPVRHADSPKSCAYMTDASMASRIHAAMEQIASALEKHDPSYICYKHDFILPDLLPERNRATSRFLISIDTLVFESETIAPFLYEACFPDAQKGAALTKTFEKFIQETISLNCSIYLDTITREGALSQEWDQLPITLL